MPGELARDSGLTAEQEMCRVLKSILELEDRLVSEMIGRFSRFRDLKSLSLDFKLQETQLSLTNLHDAFIGQSRSPNIVPLHMLDIVSYSAIVTLSLNAPFLRDTTSKMS